MLHGLIDTNRNLLLRANAIPAGECDLASRFCLSYSEPVLMVGYYSGAPVFMLDEEEAVLELLEQGVYTPNPEGASAIVLADHLDLGVICHTTIFNAAIIPGRDTTVMAV